ncbi:hypothetical protein E2C01_057322 [Portunus trituberculatus]|uniref:Uncharacterized protein n=1 Tax=Portunus trituberculatus TaxID=210409 RepID=A0A5B7H224_PORTR|nr:hypothetical protein [Portunus trituberculatus]
MPIKLLHIISCPCPLPLPLSPPSTQIYLFHSCFYLYFHYLPFYSFLLCLFTLLSFIFLFLSSLLLSVYLCFSFFLCTVLPSLSSPFIYLPHRPARDKVYLCQPLTPNSRHFSPLKAPLEFSLSTKIVSSITCVAATHQPASHRPQPLVISQSHAPGMSPAANDRAGFRDVTLR